MPHPISPIDSTNSLQKTARPLRLDSQRNPHDTTAIQPLRMRGFACESDVLNTSAFGKISEVDLVDFCFPFKSHFLERPNEDVIVDARFKRADSLAKYSKQLPLFCTIPEELSLVGIFVDFSPVEPKPFRCEIVKTRARLAFCRFNERSCIDFHNLCSNISLLRMRSRRGQVRLLLSPSQEAC